ncbi:MAG: hypothetical protein HC938_03565 [Nitrospira sp.]|nr:hypothetical protein [Nitrospira sp.]
MAKKQAAEPEEVKLKKKVVAKRASHDNSKGDSAFRSLRKRLKREQRKRRALVQQEKTSRWKQGGCHGIELRSSCRYSRVVFLHGARTQISIAGYEPARSSRQ